jgi:hypothetical protein
VETLGGTPEVKFVGNGHECFELTQLHGTCDKRFTPMAMEV